MKALRMQTRRGWTMLEMLVAITVLGVVLAILIPAISSARESSRRTQCTNNLRQFGAALHGYETVHGRFPPLSRESGKHPQTGSPISRHLYAPHVYLLPHLEQVPLFTAIDVSRPHGSVLQPGDLPGEWNVAIPVFLCPSDSGDSGTNYRCSTGAHPHWLDNKKWGGGGGAFSDLRGHSAADFNDGLSQTVMMSERRKSDDETASYGDNDYWYAGVPASVVLDADLMQQICSSLSGSPAHFYPYAGHFWLTGGYSGTLYNHVSPPNSRIPDCSTEAGGLHTEATIGNFTASSQHSGGVNVLFGDGGVRFIGNGVDLALWRALATRNEREIAN